jgi:hypothetical protein
LISNIVDHNAAEELRMGEEGIQILPDKILLKIFSYLPHKVLTLINH